MSGMRARGAVVNHARVGRLAGWRERADHNGESPRSRGTSASSGRLRAEMVMTGATPAKLA